jgi:transcriptional regulator with XRE-family HTH domain
MPRKKRDDTTFAQWLTRSREARALTQKALSIRSGLSQSMVSSLEGAERGASREAIRLLAKGLAPDNAGESEIAQIREEGMIAAGLLPERLRHLARLPVSPGTRDLYYAIERLDPETRDAVRKAVDDALRAKGITPEE